MIDAETKQILIELEQAVNVGIDKLIKKRTVAIGSDIYFYRYLCRKLEQSLGYLHKAMDKVENNV